MSVRQDKENKNCSSRGLGIAAAAIGVGVGAALYYLYSKREDPDSAGATSSWNCEREHALSNSSDSSFTTISEHSTTDTSINTTMNSTENETSFKETSFNETSDSSLNDSNDVYVDDVSYIDASDSNTDASELNTDESFTDDDPNFVTEVESNEETESFIETSLQSDTSFETGYMTLHLNYSISDSSSFSRDNTPPTRGFSIDSDTNTEWDVTTSSLDVPYDMRPNVNGRRVQSIIDRVRNIASPRVRKNRMEEQQMAILREQAFRERTWTAEECSICFDMMTQTQEVMALPCTHRFHQACILPWLQEKQTCPNCRKTA